MCEKTGEKLPPSAEVLLRQIYPNWLVDGGEPSSTAFYPWRDVDHGCLSVDRAALTTAEAAYRLATEQPPRGFGLSSVGVWGISIHEAADVGLSAWSDPVEQSTDKPANPAHAVVAFPAASEKILKKLGRALKLKAIARGRLHPST